MKKPNRKELRDNALKVLLGKEPSKWIAEDFPKELEAMVEKIRKRKSNRGQKKVFPRDVNHNSDFKPPDGKGCTYCYPVAGAINYVGKRIDRSRLKNPKNLNSYFDEE